MISVVLASEHCLLRLSSEGLLQVLVVVAGGGCRACGPTLEICVSKRRACFSSLFLAPFFWRPFVLAQERKGERKKRRVRGEKAGP